MMRLKKEAKTQGLGAAAALVLVLTPGLAMANTPGTAVQRTAAANDGAGLFRELVAAPSPLRPIHVARRLLEVGPSETGAFFAAFELAATGSGPEALGTETLVRVGRAVRDSGEIVVNMIEAAELPAAARIDATAVAIDILRRDVSRPSLLLCTRLMERLRPMEPGRLQALGPRLQRLTRGYATAGVGTDADVIALAEAVAPRSDGEPLALQDCVLEGLATGADPSASAARLMGVFGTVPSLRGGILNKVHGITRRHSVQLAPKDRRLIRDQLFSQNSFFRRESAFILGFVDDSESIPQLIQALEDPTTTVRTASHDALTRMTAMTISANKDRWQYWYERQQAWWRGEGEKTLSRIRKAPLQDLVPLLKTVAHKRLFHHEISPVLLELTRRGDSRYGDLALSALAILRAPETLPAIRELTGHRDQLIRLRAEQALSEMGAPLLDMQRTVPTTGFDG